MKLPKKKFHQHNHKINYLFLILSMFCWLGFGYIVLFVDPTIWKDIYYTPFFLVLAFSVAFSIRIVTSKLAVTILVPLGIMAILNLRLFGFKDWINSLLIILLDLALIYFFTAKETHDTVSSTNLYNQTGDSAQPEDNASIKTGTSS